MSERDAFPVGTEVQVNEYCRVRALQGLRGKVIEKGAHEFADEVTVELATEYSDADVHYLLPGELDILVRAPLATQLGPLNVMALPAIPTWADPAPTVLPTDSEARKAIPIVSGVLDYFPAALAAVARVSKAGNDKHNPGEPLHWARGKSMDQSDAIVRHLMERGERDPDTGERVSAHMAWRALALLQLELEEAGEAPLARGASE